MIDKLFKSQKCQQWGITIENKPLGLESRKLPAPELMNQDDSDKKLFASERLLKQMPIYNYDPLKTKNLFIIYEFYMEREAQATVQQLMDCQKQLQIKSGPI